MIVSFPRAAFRCALVLAGAFGLTMGCNEISGANGFETVAPVDAGGPVPDVAPVDTGPVVVPQDAGADADAGPLPPKRVFVTSTTYMGDLGGRPGADEKCNTLAGAAGLPSSGWIAWLSISTAHGDAIERITHPDAYHLLNGAEVAKDIIQLRSGTLSHSINVTESNVELTENRGVWTGTLPNGRIDATCSDWTSAASSASGTLGSTLAVDTGWTKGAPQGGLPDNWRCNNDVALYCFEQ